MIQKDYYIQVNDTMPQVRVTLTKPEADAVINLLKEVVKVDPDALCEITDGDTGEILYHNYDEWTIRNDKKHNVNYWDSIDRIIEDAIHSVAEMSMMKMDEDDVFNACYGYGLVPKIRDFIVSELEEVGGVFPFVDENY
jgi:hypothetical protein